MGASAISTADKFVFNSVQSLAQSAKHLQETLSAVGGKRDNGLAMPQKSWFQRLNFVSNSIQQGAHPFCYCVGAATFSLFARLHLS